METRANFALVGLFTLAVIAGAFGFVYWFAGQKNGQARTSYRIVFSGAVSGLQRGGLVLFNGIQVGEVTQISLLPEDPKRVIAIVEVEQNTPVRVDTRARLEANVLSGVASVQLSGGEPGAQALVREGNAPATIFAERSDFQDIVETVRKLSARVDDVIGRADKLIADNEGSLGRTVRNVETFTQALSANADGVGRFLSSTGLAAERIASLSGRAEILVNDIDALVRGVDPQRVGRIVANVETLTDTIAANRTQIDGFIKDAAGLANRLNSTVVKLDQTFSDLSALTKAFDAAAVNRAIDNADRFMQALGRNAPGVDQVLKDAQSLAAKLNVSADKIDGVLTAAQNFLGSGANGAAQSVLVDVSEAAKSFRRLSDNLDKRTASITTGINRFTGPGLREIEALTTDGRKTLTDISRTLRSLERNPSQILFGGKPAVPEYSGGR